MILLFLTGTYGVAVIYLIVNPSLTSPVFLASRYVGTPSEWFTPEDLGAVEIREVNESGSDSLLVAFQSMLIFPSDHPVLMYQHNYYQIVMPGDPGFYTLPPWPMPIPLQPILLGAILLSCGWILALTVFLRRARKK